MNRAMRFFSLLPVALALVACKSGGESPGTTSTDTNGGTEQAAAASFSSGETLYSRVGMHFDVKAGQYRGASTGFIGLSKHVPAGTKFTLADSQSRRRSTILTLKGEDDATYVLEFVPKHSMMPLDQWMERQFSSTPIEMPEGLSEDELDGIKHGRIKMGMSRQAVFLAVGYPPKSLNPSTKDRTLRYQRNKILRRSFVFDENDRIIDIGR